MNMEDLPPEIQSNILSYVPPEYAVLSCKLVSKTWKTFLSHRKIPVGLFFSIDFCGNHKLGFGYYDEILKLTMADPDENWFYKKLTKIKHPLSKKERCSNTTELIGSCNGLVCLFMCAHYLGGSNIFCIINPLTGEYFNLPAIDKKGSRIACGFGYNPSNNSYKIVKISYPRASSLKDKGFVQVYTLGGGDNRGWRDIGEINNLLYSECILWNECLHWLDRQAKIIAFDLADEKFRYLPTPCESKDTFAIQLKLLGGHLSFVGECNGRVNIWSFKDKQNGEVGYQSRSWSLEFSIPTFSLPPERHSYSCEVFAITKNNQVLLWHKTYPYGEYIISPVLLCRYDPKTDTLNKVLHWETCYVSKFQGIPHVNSLVSLKALGLDSKTTTEVAQIVRKRKRT